MLLNWTIEDGYPRRTDWYPLHTQGGMYGEYVLLIMNDMRQKALHYCEQTDGFEVCNCFQGDTIGV